MERNKPILEERTWEEFQQTGLLWWINRTLHLFGWAIVYTVEESGEVSKVYPARCRFRGFNQELEADAYTRLTRHIKENADRLVSDCEWTGDEKTNKEATCPKG